MGVRIASLEVIPYALPFHEPYVTARGRLNRRETVLLRLRSEEGLVGLGEAVPLTLRGGTPLARVAEELEGLGERESLDEATLRSAAAALSSPARCAALTALLDLRGRQAAVEIASSTPRSPFQPLSGGNDDRGAAVEDLGPVRCNATLVAGEPAEVAAEAERWAADGFSTFKLKLGVGDDVARGRAVRAALGPAARIRVDVNGAWDLATAKQALAELEPLDVELAEQPVATLEEAAELVE